MKSEPALLSFVKAIAEKRSEYRKEMKFTYLDDMGARIGDGGDKFLRVMSTDIGHDGKEMGASIYCFIATQDVENKALGKVKRGDVLKPASWKTPARHARGHIFEPDNGLSKCNHYGPMYLK